MPGDYQVVTRRRPERSSPVLAVGDPDDRSLVERARQGDRDAFQTLFERHRTMLTALVGRACGSSGLVEDIVQETALSALIGIARLERADRFGAWLAGIGLNICRRRRRQELERPSSFEKAVGARDDLSVDPSEVAIEREISRSVRAAIIGLPSGQREAAALFYLSGLTYRETALALGIDVGAVKTRLHKARARLGEELSSIWKEEEMETKKGRDMVPVRVADVLLKPHSWSARGKYRSLRSHTRGTMLHANSPGNQRPPITAPSSSGASPTWSRQARRCSPPPKGSPLPIAARPATGARARPSPSGPTSRHGCSGHRPLRSRRHAP